MEERLTISENDIVGFVMDSTKERYQRLSWQGSFSEYLSRVSEDPYKHTRTSYQLMRDMLYHFGTRRHEDNGEEVTSFRLFEDPFNEGNDRIFGLQRQIKQMVSYIDAGAREQSKERILILHGPVGTAKTSIVDTLARGLEAYTATPEGEIYTFSWRFGKDFNSEGGGGLGFGNTTKADYAGLTKPVAVLPSQLHEHPLLLIPREERRTLLERLFRQAGIDEDFVIPHKLLDGELEYNSKQIYNYLIRIYEGNWLKVMDHVLVQRIQFSESAGLGIAKIPPESNVESASQAVSIDENYRFIANLLTSVNLVRYYGKYVHGNRGIVHYSDIFKKPPAYLQHLLGAVEEHRTDFGEIGNNVDCLIIGTTNIHEFMALRNDPISKALRSRMRKLDIPYLLNYRDEEKIYRRGLRPFRKKIKIAPHTTEMASKWAVMSRIEPSELDQSEDLDRETRDLIAKLTPSTKAMIYAGQVPPEFSNKERQKLTQRMRSMLYNEHKYEGMNGIPTRTLQNLIADMCEATDADCITPFRVFDLLEELVEQGPENHDFLAREPENGWFDFSQFTTQLRREYDEILATEIGNSIVDVDEAEMESRIRKYLKHVTAYNRKEKVRNPLTSNSEAPDENMMRSVEDALGVDRTDIENYRFRLLSRASNAASEGRAVDIHELYKDVFIAVHRMLFLQKRATIRWAEIEKALQESPDALTFEKLISREHSNRFDDATTLLRNLEAMYGYVYVTARVAVLYYVRHLLTAEIQGAKA